MRRFIVALIFITTTLYVSPALTIAQSKQTIDLVDKAPSAILMERDTGEILFEKESEKRLPPASMTKIMTMILIMEALEEGKIELHDKVRTSEKAASMGGSQIFLEEGEEMTVEELLKAIAIASANDASVSLAEYIAGSEEEFVRQMNEKVQALGLKDTNFVNTTGLPAKNHYSSSKDMALMSKELLKHELITEYTSLYEDYLRQDTDDPFWLVNTNRLVKFYPGVDGLKTGYTSEAKYCLSATAKKDDMRVIAVVMGAETPKDRNSQITKMFDYAFNRYEVHKLFDRNEAVQQIEISKGTAPTVSVLTADAVSFLTEKGESPENVTHTFTFDDSLNAPIEKGERVGSLVLEKEGEIISEIPLLAAETVQKASWWQLWKRTFTKLTGGTS